MKASRAYTLIETVMAMAGLGLILLPFLKEISVQIRSSSRQISKWSFENELAIIGKEITRVGRLGDPCLKIPPPLFPPNDPPSLRPALECLISLGAGAASGQRRIRYVLRGPVAADVHTELIHRHLELHEEKLVNGNLVWEIEQRFGNVVDFILCSDLEILNGEPSCVGPPFNRPGAQDPFRVAYQLVPPQPVNRFYRFYVGGVSIEKNTEGLQRNFIGAFFRRQPVRVDLRNFPPLYYLVGGFE